MSDKVVPIRLMGKPPGPPVASKPRRARRVKKEGLQLTESDEFDGFSTLDVMNGLHGVCQALYRTWSLTNSRSMAMQNSSPYAQ
jgi:hypothetical protein